MKSDQFKPNLIAITGTGKSGTTVVAKSFFDSGFPMGTQKELSTFAWGGGNRFGVWEHQQSMDFNKQLLETRGGDWWKKPSSSMKLSSDELPFLNALAKRFQGSFCLKDPRLTWTLPAWNEVFPNVYLIACFRHPIGFARSAQKVMPELFASDQTGFWKAVEVWRNMNLQLLEHARHFSTKFIGFDDSPVRLSEQLKTTVEALGYVFNQEAFDQFFQVEDRHFRKAELEGEAELPHEVKQIWERLLAQSWFAEPRHFELESALEHTTEWQREHRIDQRLDQTLTSQAAQIQEKNEALKQASAELQLAQTKLSEKDHQIAELKEFRKRWEASSHREQQHQLLIHQLSAQIGLLSHLDRKWVRFLIELRDSVRKNGRLYNRAKALYFRCRYLGYALHDRVMRRIKPGDGEPHRINNYLKE